MPFEKGHRKFAGRNLGTKNKISDKSKELLSKIVLRELQYVWDHIKDLEFKERVKLLARLLPYDLHRLSAIELESEFNHFSDEDLDKIVSELLNAQRYENEQIRKN